MASISIDRAEFPEELRSESVYELLSENSEKRDEDSTDKSVTDRLITGVGERVYRLYRT